MQNDVLFWVWLAEQLGTSCREFKHLILTYDNPFDIFLADESELRQLGRLKPRQIERLADKNLNRAYEIIGQCEKKDIQIIPYRDPAYPLRLRDIYNPPIVLYCRGEIPQANDRFRVGMVGTRKMSEYGLRMAYKIAYEMAGLGALVVSGMAEGIDGVSAVAAMEAGEKTVAVLGCGVDMLFPKHHGVLMEEICKHGAVISEYPPGTRPINYRFPERNRIISGIAESTVVIEAGANSGSLITARAAIQQGRYVFAPPGNVGDKGSEGTNILLRSGAHFLLNTRDILHENLGWFTEDDYLRLKELEQHSKADLNVLARYGVISLVENTATQTESEGRTGEGSSGTATVTWQTTPPQPKKEKGEQDAPGTDGFAASSRAEKATKPTEQAKTARDASKKTAKTTEKAKTSPRATEQAALQGAASQAVPRTTVQTVTAAKRTPDQILSSLSPVQLAVMGTIPDDRPVSTDALNGLGYPIGEVIAALTMLEIRGLIRKLPGSLYTKT